MNSQREIESKGIVTIYAWMGVPLFYDVTPKDPNFNLNNFIQGDNVTWAEVIERLENDGYKMNSNPSERVIV